MRLRVVFGSIILITLCFSTIASAQNVPTSFEDRDAFTAATTNLTTIDFEDQPPVSWKFNPFVAKVFSAL